MLRGAWVVTVWLALGACRPTGGPTAPDGPPNGADAESPESHEVAPPSERLGQEYGCEVDIAHSLPRADGFMVAFTFRHVDSLMNDLRAKGVDVEAQLHESTARCEAERSELPEEERDYYEYEGRSCEELALAELLGEDVGPDCMLLGLAYFGLDGELLHHELFEERCVEDTGPFEEKPLVPGVEPLLVMGWSHGKYGSLTRGGWGSTATYGMLVVLQPRGTDAEDGFFGELLRADLSEEHDGGNCGHGTSRTYEFTADGSFELESQEWDDCERESCMAAAEEAMQDDDEDDEGEDDGVDLEDQCTPPLQREVARWDPEISGWTDLEAAEPDEGDDD